MEEWKDIKGYEGLYQVSNMGRVKSFNYKNTGKEGILEGSKNKLIESHKVKVINLDTGEIFNSMKEAGEKYNMKNPWNISSCCTGKRKTAGGYRWAYYNK